MKTPEPLDETLCIEFICKKINDAKAKDDKFKNFKPNLSIFKLVEDSSEENSRNSARNRREVQDEIMTKKFNDFSEKRKEFTERRVNLRPRKSDEKKKEPESDEISFSNITIDNLLERIQNSAKSMKNSNEVEKLPQKSGKSSEADPKGKQKSTIDEYFQKPDKRDEENLMQQIREEKTPQKDKKKRNLGEEKVEKTRRSLRNRSGSDNEPNQVNLEQVHPKYQQKSSKNEARNSCESSKSTSFSFSEKSSTSLNASSNALELSKHVPYTVDIEALIANANSSLEFESIKDLYPWIDENITTAIFKTKNSMEILLTELSLFSTYKCMNELCYFFTTDFEEFKKHARSHDSINNYCSYCLKVFDRSNDLCNHLDISHKFDRFQCSKCFFRSCQKGYVDVHQRVHHSNEENCEVFKSPVQKLMKCDRSKCLPALQKNREKLVMPYRCKSK